MFSKFSVAQTARETGISGNEAETEVEQFCNDIASEYLLPQSESRHSCSMDWTLIKLQSPLVPYSVCPSQPGSGAWSWNSGSCATTALPLEGTNAGHTESHSELTLSLIQEPIEWGGHSGCNELVFGSRNGTRQ